MRSCFRLVGLLALLVVPLLLDAGVLHAQYFGRNNPQFRTFDFQVLRTEHFDIYYYPEAEEGVRDAARMAERWYARLSQILDHQFRERQPLILYASHADFQQTNILGSPVGEGTGGVTESAKQRVIMPLAHTYSQTDHVLGHEIVHAFQYDMSGLGRSAGSIDAGGRALATAPLWFIEGMAEYLTLGPVDAHTAMWLRDAAITGQLPTLRQLGTDPRIFPYRYGHALWAYIAGRWGDAVVGQILRQLTEGIAYQQAMQRVLNITLEELSGDWQAAVRRTYLPLLADWSEPREVAQPLVTREQRGGRINVGPTISPDGRRLAFLSERGLLDIELWLADAETGQVIRRLVQGAAFDTHFGSLNFIASAGSFSPDGRQLAFSALRRGTNVIAIVDVDRGRVVRQYRIPDVPEITNPDWSPDGRSIAFSGSQGGLTNLYLLDVASGESRQLTTGRNADLMPVFSPDGQRIAFATDRGGGTNLDLLQFQGYRIAVYDLATGQTQLLPGMGTARNFNPVWAQDGESLFFLSDREGIANIYRQNVATGALTQVTRIFQGISGFTELSPALAGARGTNRLVFSVFDRGGYNLYRLDDAARLAGTPVEAPAPGAAPAPGPSLAGAPLPAVLPPSPRPTEAAFQRVANYLADPLAGLPSAELVAGLEPEPYRPRLSLDYIGQPQIGVTTGGAFGRGGLYGGVGGVFSDMLAHHTVFGVIQAQGQFDEVGFSAAYLYRPLRWDFGAVAQRVPYISAGRQQGFDQQGNFRDRIIALRTFDWRLQGLAQFPISRSQRVDFASGLRRLTRDIQVREAVFNPQGQFVGLEESTQGIAAVNLFESSAALVFDNSLFGWTSPFAGQRYRFEVSPTLGDFRFITGLADYRRYLWARPFTLAGRGLHFGRYAMSADAEQAVGPLFLGYPSMVRGYDYGDLSDRCIRAARTGQGQPGQEPEPCRVLSQLFGSRVAVGNVELRFPLIQALVFGGGIGIPPIEGFGFYDAGYAWGAATAPTAGLPVQEVDVERTLLSSAGFGGRINLLGYAVLEVARVRPFQGDRGWHWQFALQPGF